MNQKDPKGANVLACLFLILTCVHATQHASHTILEGIVVLRTGFPTVAAVAGVVYP